MIAFVPLLVAVVGLLLLALVKQPTLQELGRAMLWCGLLWLVYAFAGKTIRLL